MKAAEFIDKAEEAGYRPCRRLDELAETLVEAGVLEADDNPQPELRRVEVEGVLVEGPGERGRLYISTPEDRQAWAIFDATEIHYAAPLARALLAWVAAGEPQAQAAPGPLLREEGGSFASVTVEGDDGCNPARLSFRRHTEDSDWLVFGDALDNMPSYVTDETYRRIPVAALAELAAYFCPPQPQAGEVVLRLTREEAEAVSIVLSRVRPSTDRGKAALCAIEKLDKLIGEVEDDGMSLNIED